MKRLKTLIIIVGSLLGLFVLFCGAFLIIANQWISEAKLDLMQSSSQEVFEGSQQVPRSILEKGSVVRRQDLVNYLTFTKNTDAKDTLNEFFEKNVILELNSKELGIVTDIELPPLFGNDCDIIYCVQKRMTFAEIPPIFWRGLLGIEDYRFLDHQGIDPISIARAIIVDIKAMSFVQGGSTLTQQLVKNLFLSSDKKILRKIKEMVFAYYIEQKFSKEDILTAYFNEVFWGGIGGVRIKGLYSAAAFYFDRPPSKLEEYEMAILISMLKGPYYYHPVKNIDRLISRTNVVFNRLLVLDLLSHGELSKWSDKKWKRWQEGLVKKSESKVPRNIWRAIAKTSSLSDFQQFIFYQAISTTLETLDKRIEGADVGIKVLVRNLKCAENCEDFFFYNKVERDQEKALNEERHQIGSIVKPVAYSIYQKLGISLDDDVETGEITLELKSGKWSPKEASSKEIEKKIPVFQALLRSRNRPTIRLANQLGLDLVEKELEAFIPNIQKPLAEYPAQLIGAVELTMLEVANMYEKFVRLSCSAEGEFKDSLIYRLSDPNTATVRNVVQGRLKSLRFFGKTGTTNNGWDNWYVAFDGQNVFIIWFGDEKRETERKLSGASSAFRVFQNYVNNNGLRFNDLLRCSL